MRIDGHGPLFAVAAKRNFNGGAVERIREGIKDQIAAHGDLFAVDGRDALSEQLKALIAQHVAEAEEDEDDDDEGDDDDDGEDDDDN